MKGGYAKVTDLSRISGISQQDFNDTYVITEAKELDESIGQVRM